MSKLPHRHIGALIFTSRRIKRPGKGTATLISPNLIITSAHNLYNKTTGEVYYDFRFYPGQYG